VTHLKKMMLEELQRLNYAETTTRHYIRAVEDFARRFNCRPDRLGPRHIREYQAELFRNGKLSAGSITQHLSRSTLLLHQDTEEELEHNGDTVSEEGPSLANSTQPGRSHATHRCCEHPLSSNSTDDSLRYGLTVCRADALENPGYRQSAHGSSHPRR